MFKFFTPIQVTLNGDFFDALMTALAHNEANAANGKEICNSAGKLRKTIERLGGHGIDGYGERYAEMGFNISDGAALIEQFAAYSCAMLKVLRQQNEVMQAALDFAKQAGNPGNSIRTPNSSADVQNSRKVGDSFD